MNGHQLTREQRDNIRHEIDRYTRNRLTQLRKAGHLADAPTSHNDQPNRGMSPSPWRTRHRQTSRKLN